MPSGNDFVERAKEIAKQDAALYDSLLEFEKTGKIRTKERLNFTIDKNVASRFKKLCRERGYNMSAKVEQCMEQMIAKDSG